jgi:hypothetical protein
LISKKNRAISANLDQPDPDLPRVAWMPFVPC